MKTSAYKKRFYRRWTSAKDLFEAEVAVQETDVHLLTDKPIEKEYITGRILHYRRQIEGYIQKDRRFLTSLKPIAVELQAPLIIRAMAEAAQKAGVGPMAAVAGAVAWFLEKDLARRGCRQIIIENGGDIAMRTLTSRTIAIYSGNSRKLGRLRIRITPQDSPLGICTSSGTIGHSLSFGCADSVVVLAKNVALADAIATAVANRVQEKSDLKKAIWFARNIKGAKGVVIVYKNNLASWGKIEFV